MSDHIPFEIQSEIMKMLPVKSLLQFRSVSKQWRSFIDSSEFIKSYHLNHPNPQHHLLVRHKVDNLEMFTSFIDNNTFPQQKFPLPAPESLSLLTYSDDVQTLGFDKGLICYIGYYNDTTQKEKPMMVVIWNPSIRKSVAIAIPDTLYRDLILGFGVCPRTSDPKIVRISVVKEPSLWVFEVFSLSRRVWETVFVDVPFKSCCFTGNQVCIDGVIYWCADDDLDNGVRSNFIISFDLKSDKFGEVCLPERLVYARLLLVRNVNESLALLELNDDEGQGGTWVCGVWMRKDGENKPFTKMYTVKIKGRWLYQFVLGFRKNGEVVLETKDDNSNESEIKVYEPSSGRFNSVGIIGKPAPFDMWAYMETLLLLDEPNTLIHS